MGKVNIRTKAKAAIKKFKHSLESNPLKQSPVNDEDKIDLLLHKTNSASIIKKTLSKKEKYKQKHKKLMNKFTEQRKQRKKEIEKKHHEETAIIGDLKPLRDSLPSLDELFQLRKTPNELKTGLGLEEDYNNEQQQDLKNKLNTKRKIRQKKSNFARTVNSYIALLKDPDFKKNPRESIAYHIKYQHGLIQE